MLKRKCENCQYCQTDLAPTKEMVAFCYYTPPSAVLANDGQRVVQMNNPRPQVRPGKDFCSEFLANEPAKPH